MPGPTVLFALFDSAVLEIAIGLAFTYLAFSLLCSGLSEYYSAILKRRSDFLQHAIAFLVNKDDPRGKWIYTLFLEHPLIKGLAPGQLQRTREAGGGVLSLDQILTVKQLDARSKSASKRAPQYIPDTAFVNAVLDILLHGGDLFAPVPSSASGASAAGPGAIAGAVGGGAAGAAPGDGLIVAGAPLPPHLREEITTTLRNILAAVNTLPEAQRAGLTGVVNQGAADVNNLAAGSPSDAFWGVVDRTRSAIRAEIDKIADKDAQARILAALSAENQRIRSVKDNAVRVHKLTEEAGTSIKTLQGATMALSDPAARATLDTALKGGLKTVDGMNQDAVTAQEVWNALTAMFAALKGVIADVGEPEKKAALLALVDTESQRLANVKNSVVTLQRIRDAVNAMPPSEIRTALRALTEESGTTLDEIKAGIGNWYNDTMDRVSAWYKRRTAFISFVIALLVSFGLNVDTLDIATQLSQNPEMRSAIANAAGKQLTDSAGAVAKLRPAPAVATADASGSTPIPDDVFASLTPTPTTTTTTPDQEPVRPDPDEVRRKFMKLGLPIGWDSEQLKRVKGVIGPLNGALTYAVGMFGGDKHHAKADGKATAPAGTKGKAASAGATPGADDDSVVIGLYKIAGLFITTVALTMGAPFWYDVLSKFVAVGTAGKRPDKTLDDPAKKTA